MSHAETRREFLAGGLTSAATVVIASQGPSAVAGQTPWYRRACRWGQTNITEKDPVRYDIAWWREYWKRTRVQGVILNAGGIVAYYPSKYPLHRRAEFLHGRDLYGELCQAAHQDGLFVLARMDSNRAAEDFYRAHPGWFTRDSSGQPYRSGDRYVTCVNSPYYEEYLPSVLREIIERSHPEGITDNSWSGLGRESICYCDNCGKRFRARAGASIPRKKDWDDPVYREWIQWNYARRLEIWDLNNRTTRAAGGPDCLWIGMNGGSPGGQGRAFRDYKEICKRAEIIMCDHQARSDATGFQHNGESGKLIHGLLGWDKLIPESMAMYQAGRTPFRLSTKPVAEARMWMLEGFAGGIQPWWHHIGAYHEDRRMYHTAEPVMRWHEANQEYLVNRRPVATVGVVWSQQNTDFFGRDDAEELVDLPYRGMMNALIRARIPYLPVHADHVDRDAPNLKLIILPNVGAMSDTQCAAIRRFVESGGSLIATGASSLYDESGQPRKDFALADLFGAHQGAPASRNPSPGPYHTYMRLSPELRAQVWGPKAGDEPPIQGRRHPVLRGFDETDILPFGGLLTSLRRDPGVTVPLTFVPQFPVYPPETAWMREPRTSIPALVLREPGKGGRVAYMPADIDRRFAKDNLPDHGNLLANLVRWASADSIPLRVEGPGLIDCHLYRQAGRVILHLVNLTSAGTWRAAIDELIPVGPFRVQVQLPEDVAGRGVRSLVSAWNAEPTVSQGWAAFEVKSILDHEVIVIC